MLLVAAARLEVLEGVEAVLGEPSEVQPPCRREADQTADEAWLDVERLFSRLAG
jgi:hypothetical protein